MEKVSSVEKMAPVQLLKHKFKKGISNNFVLFGNVGDYTKNGKGFVPVADYLKDQLKETTDIVVCFRPGQGMYFIDSDHEKHFRELTGLVHKPSQ